MSFFIRKGGGGDKNFVAGKKRKAASEKKKAKKPRAEDEEVDSDGSDIEVRPDAGYESEDDTETAEEKRLRLAKLYLAEVEQELKERGGDTKAGVEARLQEDVDAEKGKLRKVFSGRLTNLDPTTVRSYGDKKSHKLSLTCLAVSPDSRLVYTASKDAGLVVWELATGRKVHKVPGGRKGQEATHPGHCSTVLAVAVSSDGQLLATGDVDKNIHVWSTAGDSLSKLHTFRGHRDAVSGLVFRRGTHTLYSASWDRSVKVWSVDERAYVETLFGHQDRISGLDAGARERCVTAGGRDGTARVWKIVEESQLVFNGPQTSVDNIALLNEEHWVTAGEDGHLAVWGIHKKKPLALVQRSHGTDPVNGEPYWVSALATRHNSDTVVTGSRDGLVRFWSVGEGFRSVKQVGQLAMAGFVNCLAVSACGGWLAAGLGQEHRLGRWWRDGQARNKLCLLPIPEPDEET